MVRGDYREYLQIICCPAPRLCGRVFARSWHAHRGHCSCCLCCQSKLLLLLLLPTALWPQTYIMGLAGPPSYAHGGPPLHTDTEVSLSAAGGLELVDMMDGLDEGAARRAQWQHLHTA